MIADQNVVKRNPKKSNFKIQTTTCMCQENDVESWTSTILTCNCNTSKI